MVTPVIVWRRLRLLGLVAAVLIGACSSPTETTGPPPTSAPSTSTSTSAPSTSIQTWPEFRYVLFPTLSQHEFDQLLVSDEPIAEAPEVIAGFALEVLGMDDPEITVVSDGTDSTGWLVQQGTLSVNLGTRILAWRADGSALNFVTYASSLGRADDWPLSVSITGHTGTWLLTVHFAPCSDQNEVSLGSDGWEVSVEANTGAIKVELPGEPLEPPRLTLTCHSADGELTAIDTRILEPGEFAAG